MTDIVREAYLKTADLFEQHPETYDFNSPYVPNGGPGCGSHGCVLGWVGYFLGQRDSQRYFTYDDVAEALGLGLKPEKYVDIRNRSIAPAFAPCEAYAFYNRMSTLAGTDHWMSSPTLAARVLRLYVEAYHPVAELAEAA